MKTDSKFDVNMEGAKAAGIARGVYWYSQATNEDEAVAEAKKLVALAKKYDLELPLVMDLEFSDGRFDNAYTSWRANGSEYAKKRMTAVADAFCPTADHRDILLRFIFQHLSQEVPLVWILQVL